MSVRSYLGRFQPPPPTSADEMQAMRRAAWHQQGVVVLDPRLIRDDFVRQAVINEAIRLYGRRREGGHG